MHNALAVAALSFLGFGADSVNFDGVPPGSIPPNWTFTASHTPLRARWEVRNDPTAPSRGNVLVQSSGIPGQFDFPIAVFDKDICRDGDLSVKFKIDPGRPMRTAGLIWRYQDPLNYYLLHFSAEDKNIILYRMQAGKATPIPILGAKPGATGVAHELRAGEWYVAKVIFRGTKIRVFFGNRHLFEAEDAGILTAGKTGLWTKGRTTASFDDFRIDRKN